MSRDLHERVGRAITAHFAAAGSPDREREMRAHLPVCPSCHGLYQRHLLLASLDPARIPVEDRLARSLGYRRSVRRARDRIPFGFAAALSAVAAATILLAAPRRPVDPTRSPPVSASTASTTTAPSSEAGGVGVAARGLPMAPAPELLVYRIASGSAAPEPAADWIRASDELAFVYRNTGGRQNLLIFAIDEHGHVYWYHPEWSRAADNPSGVPISSEPGLHELPAAVAHHFDGEELMIHAVFTDRELTVRQVEAAFAAAPGGGDGAGDAAARFPDATDLVRRFRVTR